MSRLAPTNAEERKKWLSAEPTLAALRKALPRLCADVERLEAQDFRWIKESEIKISKALRLDKYQAKVDQLEAKVDQLEAEIARLTEENADLRDKAKHAYDLATLLAHTGRL